MDHLMSPYTHKSAFHVFKRPVTQLQNLQSPLLRFSLEACTGEPVGYILQYGERVDKECSGVQGICEWMDRNLGQRDVLVKLRLYFETICGCKNALCRKTSIMRTRGV